MKAVFFDAVGTLFQVRGSVGAAYASVAARHGVTVIPELIEERFRAAFRGMPPLCFPGAPEPELPQRERGWWEQVVSTVFAGFQFAYFERFFDDLFESFAQADAWELFPDTVPALTGLKARGLRLGMVSNFDGRLTTLCQGLGIACYFDSIVMSGRVGCAKPDPRIFTIALDRLGMPAGEALHVGDSLIEDLDAAEAAGLRGVLIQRGSAVSDVPGQVRDLRELFNRCL